MQRETHDYASSGTPIGNCIMKSRTCTLLRGIGNVDEAI